MNALDVAHNWCRLNIIWFEMNSKFIFDELNRAPESISELKEKKAYSLTV